jgi:hypothetical protein
MIDLRNHYGFTRLPFGKDLAPSMLHQHAGCSEAAARISWCITERALGVITGEVPPSFRTADPLGSSAERDRFGGRKVQDFLS